MDNNNLTLDSLKSLIYPIAIKYGVKAVYLFGSRSRNEATDESDYDIFITKGQIRNLFQLAGFRLDLEKVLSKPVDIVTDGARDKKLLAEIERDKVLLYEAS